MPIPELNLPIHYPPDTDYTRQSYEVPGTKRPGQTGTCPVQSLADIAMLMRPLAVSRSLQEQYAAVHSALCCVRCSRARPAGAFPLISLDSPSGFINLVEFFDSGRKRSPGNAPFLGRRPLISSNPPTYANYYEWITWEQAELRIQHIGSGLTKLFSDGTAGGDPLRCFGIYSGNCPGKHRLGSSLSLRFEPISDRMAIV